MELALFLCNQANFQIAQPYVSVMLDRITFLLSAERPLEMVMRKLSDVVNMIVSRIN